MGDRETFHRELRGLKNAMEELWVCPGTMVARDDEAALEGNITVVPVWKWLLTSGSNLTIDPQSVFFEPDTDSEADHCTYFVQPVGPLQW